MVYDQNSSHYNNQLKATPKAKAVRSSPVTKTEDDACKLRSSGIHPSTYTKEERPTDQPTETVTSGTDKSVGNVSNKMKVLNGTKTPKMFLM